MKRRKFLEQSRKVFGARPAKASGHSNEGAHSLDTFLSSQTKNERKTLHVKVCLSIYLHKAVLSLISPRGSLSLSSESFWGRVEQRGHLAADRNLFRSQSMA